MPGVEPQLCWMLGSMEVDLWSHAVTVLTCPSCPLFMITERVKVSGSEWTGKMTAHDLGCTRSVFLPSMPHFIELTNGLCLTERRVVSHFFTEHVLQNMRHLLKLAETC